MRTVTTMLALATGLALAGLSYAPAIAQTAPNSGPSTSAGNGEPNAVVPGRTRRRGMMRPRRHRVMHHRNNGGPSTSGSKSPNK